MQANFLLQNIGSFFRIQPTTAQSKPTAPNINGNVTNRLDLLEARRELLRVIESFEKIDRLMNGRLGVFSGLSSARSDPSLALNLTATAATLQSAEEINATPTSFSPFVPNWTGSSSALLTIGGAYDGSNGSGAISFEVRRPGIHGQDRLRIRVRDPLGNVIRNVTLRENHALDRQYSLSNGLFLSLGPGALTNRDTTSIQVFDNVGSVADPDKLLNGIGNNNPNLQFGMPDIVDGTFSINGETISVLASQSLNDVLNTINQSSAGVSASYNTATERIDLMQNIPGSANTIDIQAGDTNFVQATKLDAAVVVPGTDPDNLRPMESVPRFSGVQSGTFLINGEPIALNAQDDSLDAVIERINSSEAAALASFDPVANRVVIKSADPGNALTIDSNGTNIFSALNMPEGRVDPQARRTGYSSFKSRQIADAIDDSVTALNDFFKESDKLGKTDPIIAGLRNQLKATFVSMFGSSDENIDTGLGISFDLDGVSKRYIRFARIDRAELIQRLQYRGAEIDRFFSGTEKQTGLLQSVGSSAQRALLSLNDTLGTKGTLFNGIA